MVLRNWGIQKAAVEAPPPAAEFERRRQGRLVWKADSPNEEARLKHQPGSDSVGCVSWCVVGSTEVWRAPECLADMDDLKFLSNDCERLVVFHQVALRGTSWSQTPVVSVFDRGVRAWDVTAGAVVKDSGMALSRPSWVQGFGGVGGTPPRYVADGGFIKFISVDGIPNRVPLVREGAPPR